MTAWPSCRRSGIVIYMNLSWQKGVGRCCHSSAGQRPGPSAGLKLSSLHCHNHSHTRRLFLLLSQCSCPAQTLYVLRYPPLPAPACRKWVAVYTFFFFFKFYGSVNQLELIAKCHSPINSHPFCCSPISHDTFNMLTASQTIDRTSRTSFRFAVFQCS